MRFDIYFQEKVEKYSQETALFFQDQNTKPIKLSYAKLNEKANHVASYLYQNKVREGTRIGIYCHRGPLYPLLFLACAKLGAIYVPLPRELKKEKLEEIIKDANIHYIVTGEVLRDEAKFNQCHHIAIDSNNLPQCKDIIYEKPKDKNPILYIIYSSGTTGNPKGIQIGHAGLKYWGKILNEVIDKNARILGNTSVGFDPHIWEYVMAWSTGGCLYFTDDVTRLSTSLLEQYMKDNYITDATFTPMLLNAFFNNQDETLLAQLRKSGLKRLYLTGEALYRYILEKCSAVNITLYNCYGPSELTFGFSIKEVNLSHINSDDKVEIGFSSGPKISAFVQRLDYGSSTQEWKNDSIQLLNDCSNSEGELLVASPYMSPGYYGKTALTEAKFFDITYNNKKYKVYRTEDVVQVIDQKLYFKGRNSDRVKRNTIWIDLANIRVVVGKYFKDKSVMFDVIYFKNEEKEYLFIFISKDTIIKEKLELKTDEIKIKQFIRSRMTENEVPDRIILLDKFPLNSNGKSDKKKLEENAKHSLKENPPVSHLQFVPPTDILELENAVRSSLINLLSQVESQSVILFQNEKETLGSIITASMSFYRLKNNIEDHFCQKLPMITSSLSFRQLLLILIRPYLLFTSAEFITSEKTNNQNYLFFLPPVTGDVSAYLHIISKDVSAVLLKHPLLHEPIYKVSVLNKLCHEAFDSISLDEQAIAYAACIKLIQQNGLYKLIGWSFGGILTLAMLKTSLGDSISEALLIDAPDLKYLKEMTLDSLNEWLNQFGKYMFEQFSLSPVMEKYETKSFEPESIINDFFSHLLPYAIKNVYLRKMLNIAKNHITSIYNFKVNYDKKFKSLTLLHSEHGLLQEKICSPDRWKEYANSINESLIPDCDHFSAMQSTILKKAVTNLWRKKQDVNPSDDNNLLTKLQAALKSKYKTNLRRNFFGDHIPINEGFIDLSLIEEDEHKQKERQLGLAEMKTDNTITEVVSAGDEALYNTNQPIFLTDLFEANKFSGTTRKILILGHAGSGKSALCQYLATLWAKSKEESSRITNGIETYLREKFDVVFWIELRELRKIVTSDLAEVLHNHCLAGLDKPTKMEVSSYIKNANNAERILFIVDGYDEIADLLNIELNHPIKTLLKDLAADYPNMILTSRPLSINDIEFDRHLENMGFADNNIESYIRKFHHNQPEKLIEYLRQSPSLWGTAHTPINLELINWLWNNNNLIFSTRQKITLTNLYQEIVSRITIDYQNKAVSANQPSFDRPSHIIGSNMINYFLRTLAYSAMKKNKTILLDRKIIQGALINTLQFHSLPTDLDKQELLLLATNKLGFLRSTGEGGTSQLNQMHYYIHLSFQEYFSAKYLAKCDKEIFKEFITSLKINKNNNFLIWKDTLSFLAGILCEKNKFKELNKLFGMLSKKIQKYHSEKELEQFILITVNCFCEVLTAEGFLENNSKIEDLLTLLKDIISKFTKICFSKDVNARTLYFLPTEKLINAFIDNEDLLQKFSHDIDLINLMNLSFLGYIDIYSYVTSERKTAADKSKKLIDIAKKINDKAQRKHFLFKIHEIGNHPLINPQWHDDQKLLYKYAKQDAGAQYKAKQAHAYNLSLVADFYDSQEIHLRSFESSIKLELDLFLYRYADTLYVAGKVISATIFCYAAIKFCFKDFNLFKNIINTQFIAKGVKELKSEDNRLDAIINITNNILNGNEIQHKDNFISHDGNMLHRFYCKLGECLHVLNELKEANLSFDMAIDNLGKTSDGNHKKIMKKDTMSDLMYVGDKYTNQLALCIEMGDNKELKRVIKNMEILLNNNKGDYSVYRLSLLNNLAISYKVNHCQNEAKNTLIQARAIFEKIKKEAHANIVGFYNDVLSKNNDLIESNDIIGQENKSFILLLNLILQQAKAREAGSIYTKTKKINYSLSVKNEDVDTLDRETHIASEEKSIKSAITKITLSQPKAVSSTAKILSVLPSTNSITPVPPKRKGHINEINRSVRQRHKDDVSRARLNHYLIPHQLQKVSHDNDEKSVQQADSVSPVLLKHKRKISLIN